MLCNLKDESVLSSLNLKGIKDSRNLSTFKLNVNDGPDDLRNLSHLGTRFGVGALSLLSRLFPLAALGRFRSLGGESEEGSGKGAG